LHYEKNHSYVNRFWANFRDTVIKNDIPDSQADSYVKWAENFAVSIKGKPLKERNLEEVKAYLAKLKEQKGISKMEIEQARRSLYLLYYKFLNFPLDSKHYKEINTEDEKQGDKGIKKSVKNDFVLKKEIRKSQEKLIENIKTELRYKHYSLKTEYSYIDWVLRYLSFYDGESPENLGSKEIKTYLDFLAVDREVSSSTQNQALNAIVFMYTQVLKYDPGDFSDFSRAKHKRNIPVVLTGDG
jgi:hypothetical protein